MSSPAYRICTTCGCYSGGAPGAETKKTVLVAVAKTPYKCPPLPFEVAFLLDAMARKIKKPLKAIGADGRSGSSAVLGAGPGTFRRFEGRGPGSMEGASLVCLCVRHTRRPCCPKVASASCRNLGTSEHLFSTKLSLFKFAAINDHARPVR